MAHTHTISFVLLVTLGAIFSSSLLLITSNPNTLVRILIWPTLRPIVSYHQQPYLVALVFPTHMIIWYVHRDMQKFEMLWARAPNVNYFEN